MSPFWMVMISFAAGALAGWFFTLKSSGGRSAGKLQAELDETRAAHERYREEVDRHFVQTSNLVNNLTQSYKEVHAHLSRGAQSLCSDDLASMLQASTTPLIAGAIDGEGRHETDLDEHAQTEGDGNANPASALAHEASEEDTPVAQRSAEQPSDDTGSEVDAAAASGRRDGQ